jgi:hypothetical protein
MPGFGWNELFDLGLNLRDFHTALDLHARVGNHSAPRFSQDRSTRRVLTAVILKLCDLFEPRVTQEGGTPVLSVSILYSNCESQHTLAAAAAASMIGILVGALHCIAWNFHFLSQPERTLWRIWSTIITTAPILPFTVSFLRFLIRGRYVSSGIIFPIDQNVLSWGRGSILRFAHRVSDRLGAHAPMINNILDVDLHRQPFSLQRRVEDESPHQSDTWAPGLHDIALVYIVGRAGLLVQAIVALRNLQPAERAQVNWVNFLPHL